MDEWIERYLRYLRVERNASPHTVRNYASDLRQFRDYLREGNPSTLRLRSLRQGSESPTGSSTDEPKIAKVDALAVRGFIARLYEREKKKASIARKLAAVRAFFKFLAREQVIAASPAAAVSSPKLEKHLPRILSEEEMNSFLDQLCRTAQAGDRAMVRDRAILELLYASGLRVSELVGLDLRSVSFDDGMVLVRGKGRKERMVPFGSKAKDALAAYLPVREKVLMESRGAGPVSPALFLNARGGRLTTRSVDRLVKKYIRALGLNVKASPHSMRHAIASDLLDEGADLRAIQEMLGHESLATTQKYTQVSIKHLMEVYDKTHPKA